MISPQVPDIEKGFWESFTLAFNLTPSPPHIVLIQNCLTIYGRSHSPRVFQSESAWGIKVMGTMQGTMGIEGKRLGRFSFVLYSTCLLLT